MSLTKSLELSLQLIFSQFDLFALLWAAVVFLLSFVVIGLIWGMCWNHKWAYVGHLPSTVWSAVSALCLAIVILDGRVATKAPTRIQTQIVSPDNEWSKAAIKDQIRTAFDSASNEVRQRMEDLKTPLMTLGVTIFLIQVVSIPIAACRDIRENPRV